MDNQNYQLMTKAEFSDKIGICASTRAKWLNSLYYDKIKPLGYQKNSRFLNAKVVKYLFEILVYTDED